MRALATCALFGGAGDDQPPSARLASAQSVLEESGCSSVVLDAWLPREIWHLWRAELEALSPRTAAVHVPSPRPRPRRSGVAYCAEDLRLAAADAHVRADGLALARPALDVAEGVGAPIVVVEGGPVLAARPERPMAAGRGVGAAQAAVERAAAADVRRRLSSEAVDALSFAVEALISAIEARGLTLAVSEQRAYDWFGTPAELTMVLERFAGAPLVWWADPLGRTDSELSAGCGAAAGTAPAGVWWRLPARAEECVLNDVSDAFVQPAGDSDVIHVLAPAGDRLLPWHRDAWERLGSCSL